MSDSKSEQYLLKLINRREMFMGAGMLTMLGMQEAMAGGHTAGRVELSEEEQTALEKANAELITNFVNDYSKRDADLLTKYMADDGRELEIYYTLSVDGANSLAEANKNI